MIGETMRRPDPHAGETRPRIRFARTRRAVRVAGWLTLATAVGLWLAIRQADVWCLATVLMFAPLPLLVLLPLALVALAVIFSRRALLTVAPALILMIVPIARFCIPWCPVWSTPVAGPRLRVLTCNMHYTRSTSARLDRLIIESDPDVVAIQEFRDSARSEELTRTGWHTHQLPGLFLASRFPIRKAERIGPHSTDPDGSVGRYELLTPEVVITLFSVHLASPRDGLDAIANRAAGGMDELAANSELRREQARRLALKANRTTGPVLLVGDFNTPPQSAIWREDWEGYEDAFGVAGWGWGHTFSARLSSVRIDHVLIGRRGWATHCWVGPNVGSPHRPVIADVVWPARATE